MSSAGHPTRVVMIGTDPATHGGISAALRVWEEAGLFGRWPVIYVPTHRDGTRLQKLGRALAAFATFAALVCRMPRAVLHVNAASRASFWRKAPFMALALAARWPVVFHLHGGGFADFYERECGAIRRRIVHFFLARAACIAVVSVRWGMWMRGVVPGARVVCVPNAVAVPPDAGGEREPGVIAFIGRLSARKGVFELLEAVAALRARHPGVRLELAGDGDLEAVARRAHELGIGERVLLRGWCPAPVRGRILARAAVFALPSHAEGSPMSLLEAMAAGCAVVATRVGGIPDSVCDGQNGLLVPAGDSNGLAAALGRLLDHPELAAQLGVAARASIAHGHAPARAIQRIGRIYAALGQEHA
jgi:glycosyltransferase involved in cell wall biosynthesis